MKRTKKFIILAVSLFFIYGCSGGTSALLLGLGAGAGGGIIGYKYLEGHTAKEFPLAYSKAWDVSNTALENLNISISTSESKDTQGVINGLQKDGKKVSIRLKERSQWVTTISVRVGRVGNRNDAETILNEIALVAGL